MKIKINKDGKKETYSTINSWSDVSLESWMKLIEVETGSQAIQAEETIAALSDIPKTLIKELSIADVAVIMSKIAEMQSKQDSSLKKIFKIEGIEYGMHPNLDLLTLGEYADIETFIKNGIEQNMPEVLAVLFRPVTERKEEAYTIESYDGEITIRTEIMKKMSAEQVQAALFFFWNLGKELSKILPLCLMERTAEILERLQTETSQNAGDGSE